MYKIENYNESNKKLLFNFLKLEFEKSKDRAIENMWHNEWTNKFNTLPYLLENTNRFVEPKGNFYILKNFDEIIGCSGVYISDFSDMVSICGVRLYIQKQFRNKLLPREFLFPAQKKWSIDKGCKIFALSFNQYNKILINSFTRFRLSETRGKISKQTPEKLFFNGVNVLEFPVKIQNTKQYIIYEKLDENFDFDWNIIKY
jgi:hypothetical protein